MSFNSSMSDHQQELTSSRPEVGQESKSVISNSRGELVNWGRYNLRVSHSRTSFSGCGPELDNNSKLYPVIFVSIILQALIVNQLVAVSLPVPVLAGGRMAQDVALDELEEASSGGGSSVSANENSDADRGGSGSSAALEDAGGGAGDKMKNLDALLETLPVLSVGQKHSARFECELNNKDGAATQPVSLVKLVWVKLMRGQELASSYHNQRLRAEGKLKSQGRDDIKLISLDQKLITPDRRFKVHKQAAYKWALTIDNVQPDDGNAYYLCQASAAEQASTVSSLIECKQPPVAGARATGNSSSSSDALCQRRRLPSSPLPTPPEVGRRGPATSSFVGGARLNVLAPPKIVENETSPSLVVANEHESLHLKCKVSGEPQSQLMWKREDNKPFDFDDVEQRFRHESKRKPNHQILSIDSSELIFEPFLRSHSGAYLCIASNGIQAGVSQRINVVATNCRAHQHPPSGGGGSSHSNGTESCDKPAAEPPLAPPEVAHTSKSVTTASSITTTSDGQQQPPAAAIRKAWRTSSGRQQQQQQQDSQLQGKYATGKNRPVADKRRANGGRGNGNATSNGNELLQQPTTTNGLPGQISIRQTTDSSAANCRLQAANLISSWLLIYCVSRYLIQLGC